MYNKNVYKYLLSITENDSIILENQTVYTCDYDYSKLEFYISNKKVSFRILGDAYLTCMAKWLQKNILNENIKNTSIQYLVETFEIPNNKLINATIILEMIKKIYS